MLKLNNKKIAILGLGLENLALVKYLLKHGVKCEITICDAHRSIKEKIEGTGSRVTRPTRKTSLRVVAGAEPGMTKIFWQLGKGYNKNLDKFDILFRAPGWPLDCPGIKIAKKKGIKISSPMKLFFDLCPSKNIIGVTGTKGKGTMASLIYEILKLAGKKACLSGRQVWLGGNIGIAPFAFMDKIKKNDWVILELSSFQLEDMAVSPHIAVVTNLYPEHLKPADPNNPNFHKTIDDYRKAKWNIVRWQEKNDYSIFNFQFSIFKESKNTKAKLIYFKKSELPSKLIGEHNKENVAAAVAVAKIIGIKSEIIKKAVANFKGLEHRLEFVKEIGGVKYYDDSFATTPESTIIALKSFAAPATLRLRGGRAAPIVLLLGGADKGADFNQLVKEVKKRCKFVVLLAGKATPRIKKELLKIGYGNNKMALADNIKKAVRLARAEAKSGEVVLLSTACASFGMFKNYKERGDLFKNLVKK